MKAGEAPSGPAFWIGSALGGAIIAFGAYGLLHNLRGVALTSWVKTFAGALIAHDLIFAPLVVVGSFVLMRAVPGRARTPIQVAFIVSGALVAIAIPVVHGAGRLGNNASLLPSQHYGARLLGALAVVWLVAAVVAAARVRRSHSTTPT